LAKFDLLVLFNCQTALQFETMMGEFKVVGSPLSFCRSTVIFWLLFRVDCLWRGVGNRLKKGDYSDRRSDLRPNSAMPSLKAAEVFPQILGWFLPPQLASASRSAAEFLLVK
jgi:hypothetical protein